MGDRATFVFEQKNASPIFLYGHWAGADMMATLADAIVAAWYRIEMEDEPYATRIMISNIIDVEWKQETGWGLSTYFCDSEHSVPVINVIDKTVRLLPCPGYADKFDINAEPKFTMSLQQFLDKFAKVLV